MDVTDGLVRGMPVKNTGKPILMPVGDPGLGRVLIVDLLKNAVDMGFTTAISALMHVANRSQKISADCAGPMRRYELLVKDLAK